MLQSNMTFYDISFTRCPTCRNWICIDSSIQQLGITKFPMLLQICILCHNQGRYVQHYRQWQLQKQLVSVCVFKGLSTNVVEAQPSTEIKILPWKRNSNPFPCISFQLLLCDSKVLKWFTSKITFLQLSRKCCNP